MNRSYGDDLFSAEIDKRFTWRCVLIASAITAFLSIVYIAIQGC